MLWFFALTEDSTAFRQYAEMLMVAVHTARKFTSLVPHFIYDGSDNDFTAWLRRHDVRIIRHRSLFRDSLAELGRDNLATAGATRSRKPVQRVQRTEKEAHSERSRHPP
jgi:hypothetical protein